MRDCGDVPAASACNAAYAGPAGHGTDTISASNTLARRGPCEVRVVGSMFNVCFLVGTPRVAGEVPTTTTAPASQRPAAMIALSAK